MFVFNMENSDLKELNEFTAHFVVDGLDNIVHSTTSMDLYEVVSAVTNLMARAFPDTIIVCKSFSFNSNINSSCQENDPQKKATE